MVKERIFKNITRARKFRESLPEGSYEYMINDEDLNGQPFWHVYYRAY